MGSVAAGWRHHFVPGVVLSLMAVLAACGSGERAGAPPITAATNDAATTEAVEPPRSDEPDPPPDGGGLPAPGGGCGTDLVGTVALPPALPVAWSTRLTPTDPEDISGDGRAALAVDGATAYVWLVDGSLHAVDVVTGVRRWTVDLADHGAAKLAAAGGTAYVAAADGTLRAIDGATGTTRWSVTTGTQPVTPVVVGDVVVTGAGPDPDVLDAPPPAFVTAYSVTDGTTAWQVPVPSATAYVVRAGDLVVAASAEPPDPGGTERPGTALGLDPGSGAERWRSEMPPGLVAPVAAGGSVYLLGTRTLVALDEATGQERWRAGGLGDSPGWAVEVAATPAGILAVVGGMTWYALGFDPSGACHWNVWDNGEGGFVVTGVGSALYVQSTNCGPLQADPATGEHPGWLDPNATPGRPGDTGEDICAGHPDLALAPAGDTVLAAGGSLVFASR